MNSIQAYRQWRTFLEATKSADTVRGYTGNVHRFMVEVGPVDDVREYTEDLCAWFFSPKGWVNRGHAKYEYAKALRAFFRWCVRRGLMASDPMTEIQMKKPRRRRPVALTEEELTRVVIAAALLSGERVAWAILLIYLLALRRKEAAGLKWEHIVETPRGPAIELREAKGEPEGEGVHQVLLSPLAVECMGRLRELPPNPRSRLGPEYILRGRRGTVSGWVHDAGTAAGLEPRKVGAHRLRAAMATNMLRAGVDIRVVQATLRHLHLSSTEWYVEDAMSSEVLAAQDLMARRLQGAPAA